jgi:3-oxoacyl-[acyl-carrier protein] reductase
MRLQNKVCMISGGSRGIGRSIAECFLQEGAVVNVLDINEEEGLRAAEEMKALFPEGKIFFFKADITKEDEIADAVDKIIENCSQIDVLVNNAGITMDNLMLRMDIKSWQAVLDVNLTGAFLLSKYVARSMMKKKQGSIINISSIVGLHGNAGQCNYSASKAGLVGLTKSMAKELASRNINVNAIAPGYIETDMTAKLSDDVKEKLLGSIPCAKLGSPKDVAKAALFLATEDSAYITGTVLNVDGGMGI